MWKSGGRGVDQSTDECVSIAGSEACGGKDDASVVHRLLPVGVVAAKVWVRRRVLQELLHHRLRHGLAPRKVAIDGPWGGADLKLLPLPLMRVGHCVVRAAADVLRRRSRGGLEPVPAHDAEAVEDVLKGVSVQLVIGLGVGQLVNAGALGVSWGRRRRRKSM